MKNGVSWDVSRVALLRTDVSEELGPSIRVARIGELGTTLAATSNRRTLRRACVSSSETSVLTRAPRRIPEDTILHSHRRENLKSYKTNLNMITQQLTKKD
jgi:hypothetical protein